MSRPRTALEAARHALLPGPYHPEAFDLVTRIDAFERHVYLRGWVHGCTWGAAIAGGSVSIGLLLIFLAG